MNRFRPIRATPVNVGHMDRPLVPPTHDGSRIAIEIGNSAAGSHAEEPATFREPSGEQKRIAVGWGLHPYQVAADALGTRNASVQAIRTADAEPTSVSIVIGHHPSRELTWLPRSNPETAPHDDHRVRIGAYAVIINDGRLLLTQLRHGIPSGGLWLLPGGGLDPGESPETGLLREVYEETSLHPTDVAFASIDSDVLPSAKGWTPVHYLRLLYTARASGDPRVAHTEDSTIDAKWWPLDALPEVMSAVPRALQLTGIC